MAIKSDINKENDKMTSAGLSALYHSKKAAKNKAEALKDEETKQKTLDFIFGKSEDNPLANIK